MPSLVRYCPGVVIPERYGETVLERGPLGSVLAMLNEGLLKESGSVRTLLPCMRGVMGLPCVSPGFALTTSEEVREARARPEGGNAADRNAIGEPTEPLVRDLAVLEAAGEPRSV